MHRNEAPLAATLHDLRLRIHGQGRTRCACGEVRCAAHNYICPNQSVTAAVRAMVDFDSVDISIPAKVDLPPLSFFRTSLCLGARSIDEHPARVPVDGQSGGPA